MRTLFLGLLLLAGVSHAGERAIAVSAVHDLASSSARSWADDARLVYVENDADVDATGLASRWGFLFYSASRDEARAYSLRDGRVVRADDLSFDFDAAPLADDWIDSDDALRRAEKEGGAAYRSDHAAELRTMLLTRGLMHLDDPDRTTWTCVYDAPGQPSLWIVLDARNGDLLRRWKG